MGCSESKDVLDRAKAKPVSPNGGPSGPSSVRLRQVSAVKRDGSLQKAEAMFQLTKGKRFYDNYVRPTLVSYGATCKVLTAYKRDTDRKFAVKTITKVRARRSDAGQFPPGSSSSSSSEHTEP